MNINKPLAIDQPKVGELIRELRLSAGLTQEQFGAVIGVTYSTINRWENAKSKPSPLAMEKVRTMLQDLGNSGQKLLVKYCQN